MKITVKGYSTITGSPEAILRLLRCAHYLESEGLPIESSYTAEQMLTAMENENMIIIEER